MAVLATLALPTLARAADEEAEAKALSPEGINGEILDVAIEHCRRGERDTALSMFRAIRAQLDPPPAIRRLVDDLEATGCPTPVTTAGGSLRVQLSAGWDSNVSQGISARSLTIGSGLDTLELELDESYRPRSSAYTQAAADYTFSLPAKGLTLQAAVGRRRNEAAHEFDLETLSALAAWETSAAGRPLRLQYEAAEIRLGGLRYQNNQAVLGHMVFPDGKGAWIAAVGAAQLRYVTQPVQNSSQYEVGLLREWRLHAAASAHAGLYWQQDQARSTRPGGDRQGWQLQAGALVLTHGWRLRPQLTWAEWRSDDLFAPGLIDERRRNKTTQLSFAAERPLTPQTSLLLDARARWSRDNIPLYRYQARSFTATLSHRF